MFAKMKTQLFYTININLHNESSFNLTIAFISGNINS